jgi:hypothetical protein
MRLAKPRSSSRQIGGGRGCDAARCWWWWRRPYTLLWSFWRCVVMVVLVTWHYCHVIGDVAQISI